MSEMTARKIMCMGRKVACSRFRAFEFVDALCAVGDNKPGGAILVVMSVFGHSLVRLVARLS